MTNLCVIPGGCVPPPIYFNSAVCNPIDHVMLQVTIPSLPIGKIKAI